MSAERTARRTRTLRTDVLARVEGEGAMFVRIRDGAVRDVELRIYEPPRFFEPLLAGRDFREAPDITARICGICPIAYQMSAVSAMERLCGVTVDGPIRDLRRLIYCGEWIESHALHVFFLHLPDFLGYDGAIEMAADHRAVVERGLFLKKTGNRVMSLLGGREIHPVNVRVGGFYKLPDRTTLEEIRDDLVRGRDESARTVRDVARLEFPVLERDYDLVALRHPDEYPLTEGRIVSSRGLDVDIEEFDREFVEEHVAHSNALHCVHRDRGPYLVGPMARFAINADRLDDDTRSLAREVGLDPSERNPFRSIVVRALETFWAFGEALRILDGYEPPEAPAVPVEPRAGTASGCSEAPRGLCWHRYEVDGAGIIRAARIVPPTSQNQRSMERDLRAVVEAHADLDDEALTLLCEQSIRNHDPCISCATHFLRLRVDRG